MKLPFPFTAENALKPCNLIPTKQAERKADQASCSERDALGKGRAASARGPQGGRGDGRPGAAARSRGGTEWLGQRQPPSEAPPPVLPRR